MRTWKLALGLTVIMSVVLPAVGTSTAQATATASKPSTTSHYAYAARSHGTSRTSFHATSISSASASVVEFQLFNTTTGLCADLPGTAGPTLNDQVWQDICYFGSSDNQMWYATQVGTASNGWPLYRIQNALSTAPQGGNLCLDLPGYGADAAGTHVYSYTCTSPASSDNQEWEILPVYDISTSPKTYIGSEIWNYTSHGLCLDVAGWYPSSDMKGETDLTVYTCSNSAWGNHGLDDHTWELYDGSGPYIPNGGTTINVG